MRYRRLGRTGLQVSELGHGTWGIGKSNWIGAEDEESLRAMRRAIELGVNFIDTALAYGNGHSEKLVGRAVREAGTAVYVATKIPPKNLVWPARDGTPAADAFPPDWIVESTERSLANLGLETIDLQQFHVWSDEWVGRGNWLAEIDRLKQDGKIRFFGVSVNDHQPANVIRLVESGAVDTVQVIYNIFDQSPEDELFPAVQSASVGVIVRAPLDEGSLTGTVRPDTQFPPGDFRERYFKDDRKNEVWSRAQAIAHDVGMPVDVTSPRRRCASASVRLRSPPCSLECGPSATSSAMSLQSSAGPSARSSCPRFGNTAGCATSTLEKRRGPDPRCRDRWRGATWVCANLVNTLLTLM